MIESLNKVGKGIHLFLISFLVLGSIVFGLLHFTDQKIGINLSVSLPEYVYLIKKNEVFKKGDYIQFSYESDDERFLKNGTQVIKQVIGVPGDEVVFKDRKILINGVNFGVVKTHSMKGDKLDVNKSKILEEDEFFVFTPHIDSFDSRYSHMGYISKKQVIGKVTWAF